MNLEHLRWALEVERYGSMTVAASHLFIAQSNLSNAIKALEKELGFTLFVRSSKGVVPTAEGLAFFDQSRSSVQQLLSLRDTYEKKIFSISVHRHCTFVADAIGRLMPEISENGYTLRVKEMGESEILDSVHSGESVFGVVFYLPDRDFSFLDRLNSRSLKETVLGEMPAMALISEDHPLLKKTSVSANDFSEYPGIAYEENESRSFPFEAQISYVGMTPPKGAVLCSDREMLMSLVRDTQAVFITSMVHPDLIERYHLRCIPSGQFVRRFSIIRPAGTRLSPFGQTLLEAVKASFRAAAEAAAQSRG